MVITIIYITSVFVT